jgi:hypothetical protein
MNAAVNYFPCMPSWRQLGQCAATCTSELTNSLHLQAMECNVITASTGSASTKM